MSKTDEPTSPYPSLHGYIDAVISGREPAGRPFHCPTCGGPVSIRVSPHRDNRLAVSVHCACSALELDGVPKWPGWEAFQRALISEEQTNPLGLQHGQGLRRSATAQGRQTTPCPHCGAPLATNRAKQCFVCGMDWHDPDHVVCRKDPQWNRLGLKWKSQYVVELCQDPSGQRYTKYREVDGGEPDPHRIYETPPHPAWQWIEWGYYAYAQFVATTTGDRFTFDAHGVWLTWVEVNQMHRNARGELGWKDIRWSTAQPPQFPPK